jgi:hypothetical protein
MGDMFKSSSSGGMVKMMDTTKKGVGETSGGMDECSVH